MDNSTCTNIYTPTAHEYMLCSTLIKAWESNSFDDSQIQTNHSQILCFARHMRSLCQAHRGDSSISQDKIRWVAFSGFGNMVLRNAVLSIVRYYFKPRFIHSAMIDNGRWEGLMGIRVPESAVSDIFEHFCASVVTIEIETFMGDAMMACLDRIQRGSYFWGNYFNSKSKGFRSMYAATLHRAAAKQVVLRTGRQFSPQEMMRMYDELQEEIRHWRCAHNANVRESREHLDLVYLVIDDVCRALMAICERPSGVEAMLGVSRNIARCIEMLHEVTYSREQFLRGNHHGTSSATSY